jgi:hypothetical protein
MRKILHKIGVNPTGSEESVGLTRSGSVSWHAFLGRCHVNEPERNIMIEHCFYRALSLFLRVRDRLFIGRHVFVPVIPYKLMGGLQCEMLPLDQALDVVGEFDP